jgi:uncharacterized membrane-anchored protein YhcB (DUF1043 family)
MSWWLFLQLVLLILLVGLVIGAVSQNFIDNLYKRRDENMRNQLQNWRSVPVTHIVKDSSES